MGVGLRVYVRGLPRTIEPVILTIRLKVSESQSEDSIFCGPWYTALPHIGYQ
jgi:hypothetical protein